MFPTPSTSRYSGSKQVGEQRQPSRFHISVVLDDELNGLFVIDEPALKLFIFHSRQDFLKLWARGESKRDQVFAGDQQLWRDILLIPPLVSAHRIRVVRKV